MSFQRKNPYRTKFRFAAGFAVGLFIWLLLSIMADRSPIKTLGDIPSFFGGSDTESDAAKLVRLEKEAVLKDALIDSLEQNQMTKLKALSSESSNNFAATQGIVDIESDKLNLRSRPSLNSKIVLKLPDSSEVDILEWDKKVYYLDGKSGYWCKVRFIDIEGWAWGNYIKIVE